MCREHEYQLHYTSICCLQLSLSDLLEMFDFSVRALLLSSAPLTCSVKWIM